MNLIDIECVPNKHAFNNGGSFVGIICDIEYKSYGSILIYAFNNFDINHIDNLKFELEKLQYFLYKNNTWVKYDEINYIAFKENIFRQLLERINEVIITHNYYENSIAALIPNILLEIDKIGNIDDIDIYNDFYDFSGYYCIIPKEIIKIILEFLYTFDKHWNEVNFS